MEINMAWMTSIAFPRCCYWNMCKETQHNWYVLETLEVSCCSCQLHRRLESGIFINHDHNSKYQIIRMIQNPSKLIFFTYLCSSIRCRKVIYKLVVIHVCETSVGQIVFTIRTLKSEIGNKIYDILLTAKNRLNAWSGNRVLKSWLDWLTQQISSLRLLDHFCRRLRWYRHQTHYLRPMSHPFQPCFCKYDESIH